MNPGDSNIALAELLHRATALIERLEQRLPPPAQPTDWNAALAYRWRGAGYGEPFQPIRRPHRLRLTDLLCIDRQKTELDRNTRQFLHGYPANNALLWGARGTGKSSLIKALLTEYGERGLRVVEVDPRHLVELPEILDSLCLRPEKFIIYCDDLSFEADDPGYKALKAVLEGSVSATPENVLIYATSNRRHLMPELQADNAATRRVEDEIHPGEAVEEKISLSERFGLWLSFYPFSQDDYLAIVRYWLERLETLPDDFDAVRGEALRYALYRGSRSGRVAFQFANDWSGRSLLQADR